MAAMGGAGGGANTTAELEELNKLWREKAILKKDIEDKKKFREVFYDKLITNNALKINEKLSIPSEYNRSFAGGKSQLPGLLKYYLGVTIDEDREHVKDLSETIEWLQRITRSGIPIFTKEEIDNIRSAMLSILKLQEGGRRRGKRSTRRRRTTRRRRSSQRR